MTDPCARAGASDPPPEPAPRTLLFVCLGNLIRSPIAAALTQKRLSERGLAGRYRILSAGVIAAGGQVSPPEAIRVAARRGLDLKRHLSTPLTRDLISEAHLVVAVDRMIAEIILNLVPDLGPGLKLLTQFAPTRGTLDVPDPMGESEDVYEEACRLIDACVDGLVNALAAADTHTGGSE